jgi:hypothetical protein
MSVSDCISLNGSDIEMAENYDDTYSLATHITEEYYGYSTIPLHPFLMRDKVIITEENYKTFEQTPESVIKSVEDWGPSIYYVRDEFITYDLCERAIKNHNWAIGSIKPHLLTEEEYYKLCLQSVTENGWTMKEIPEEVQTQELCDTAVKSICWALQFCLDKYKTYENCYSAVERNGEIIEHVPKRFIDEKLCMAAAKSRYPCLHLIPKGLITKEMCDEAVKANGENVKGVPDEFMSTALGWLAIKSPAPSNPSDDMAGGNIKYIPAKYLTKELIVESAKKWYCTYSSIPKEYITEEIEEAVLEVAPYCIRDMKQTPERCLKAMKKYPSVLSDCIEVENITSELVEYFESLDYSTKYSIMRMCSDEKLKHINSFLKKKKEMMTKEEILENCRVCYWRYLNIPKELITDELNKDILKVSPYCIMYMEQTPENCMIAIKQQPLVAEGSIQREKLTREMAEYILGLSDEIKDKFMDEDWDYFKSLL